MWEKDEDGNQTLALLILKSGRQDTAKNKIKKNF